MLRELVVETFCGSSAGDSIASTKGLVRSNGGRGVALEVRSLGATIATVLDDFIFSTPVRSASRGFAFEFVMVVAANFVVVV